jgi:hypothetical protein
MDELHQGIAAALPTMQVMILLRKFPGNARNLGGDMKSVQYRGSRAKFLQQTSGGGAGGRGLSVDAFLLFYTDFI